MTSSNRPQEATLEAEVSTIIAAQVKHGWLLDQRKVYMLLAELKEKKIELESTVRQTFRPACKRGKEVTPKSKAGGGYSKVGLKFMGDDCLDVVGGPFSRVEFPEFNLGSRKQAGEYLTRLGWAPYAFTPTGLPEVSEAVLKDLPNFPEATMIADYMTLQKRIAMAQSWLDFVQDDGRVHGLVNTNGCITGRMSHEQPNMGQVTSGTKIYGKEMRACWIVREGYKLVGVDASGLELRMLAHYMNDEDYTREVADGDVHTANQRAAGLPSRDTAKTFIYAFLYGAGDAKIGSIVGGTAKDGKRLKAKFLRNTPALASLRERVTTAAKRGWLRGLDGRRLTIRSPHAALNTLLQGAGAVVMKQALVNANRMAVTHKLDYGFTGNIHDEMQSEVLEAHAETFGKLATYAITKAGTDFELNVPLAGEYKIGDSWEETH